MLADCWAPSRPSACLPPFASAAPASQRSWRHRWVSRPRGLSGKGVTSVPPGEQVAVDEHVAGGRTAPLDVIPADLLPSRPARQAGFRCTCAWRVQINADRYALRYQIAAARRSPGNVCTEKPVPEHRMKNAATDAFAFVRAESMLCPFRLACGRRKPVFWRSEGRSTHVGPGPAFASW